MDYPPFHSSLVDGCRALTCLPFHQGPLSGLAAAVWPAGDPLMANKTGPSSQRLERSMGLAAPRVREPEEIRLDPPVLTSCGGSCHRKWAELTQVAAGD